MGTNPTERLFKGIARQMLQPLSNVEGERPGGVEDGSVKIKISGIPKISSGSEEAGSGICAEAQRGSATTFQANLESRPNGRRSAYPCLPTTKASQSRPARARRRNGRFLVSLFPRLGHLDKTPNEQLGELGLRSE
jgi:hypothetical protein